MNTLVEPAEFKNLWSRAVIVVCRNESIKEYSSVRTRIYLVPVAYCIISDRLPTNLLLR